MSDSGEIVHVRVKMMRKEMKKLKKRIKSGGQYDEKEGQKAKREECAS